MQICFAYDKKKAWVYIILYYIPFTIHLILSTYTHVYYWNFKILSPQGTSNRKTVAVVEI